ncbi:MAG: hypothetical protein ACSHWW_13515 [Nonlabens sp.]|uniref:hypothetical protein n=1 Tax=Nonlabens sp. TaxID=1888209 RepID=UPI003EF7A75F
MNNINYKKWAFHFIIWVVIINLIKLFLLSNYANFPRIQDSIPQVASALYLLSIVLLIATLIYVIISVVKKETRNYQFWIAAIGFFLFGIFPYLFWILLFWFK